MHDIYVDADACPVKDEIWQVAGRYGLMVYMVSNQGTRIPAGVRGRSVLVSDGLDVADDWIAERAGEGDIVVSTDVPLAARCVANGARVLTPKGRLLDASNVGEVRATRDLMTHLREAGTVTSGPAPMTKQDRSRFLSALDGAVQAVRRGA